MSAPHQPGGRLVSLERCDYLLPTIVFCRSVDAAMARKEHMFPFATVVECPQAEMLDGHWFNTSRHGPHERPGVPS
jgi:hypothetical protein